jgi:iron(III) transport system permease protein
MIAAALLVLAVLAWLPFGAALSELLVDPAAMLTAATSPRVLGLMGSTVLLGLCVALGSCLVGVPVGRLLANHRGGLAGTVALLLPLPLVLPPWMTGVAWTRLFDLSGLWGASFLLTASLWPLVALFALRGFRAAARAGDAARLLRPDGAAAWWGVELPLALPSILSGALLVFVFAVTDFAAVDYLSFADPEPFVVLASEIFQRWARLESSGGAAAVSLAAVLPTLLALAGVLWLERRHEGRQRGTAAAARRAAPPTAASRGALGVVLAVLLLPVGVLATWSAAAPAPLEALSAARDSALASVSAALGAGALVAVAGVLVARATLVAPRRWGALLLGGALLPLAAPGVMFAVGEVRIWNHPANPLADLVHPSPALLVLALAGRYLPLGVLAARALLVRQDEGPLEAARLTGRSPLTVFRAVMLPLMAPALALSLTLGYLLSMRELDMIVLVPAGSATLAHRIFSMVHIASDDVTAVLCLALLVLALVPALAARLLGLTGVGCGPDDTLG